MAQTLRLSRKCLLQTDKLIERKITRYSQILFQEFKIANFTRLSFTSLPLLKLLEDVFAPVHD